MPFTPPTWASGFDVDEIPDSIPICEFIFNEKYGRFKRKDSKAPFVCGVSGRQYSVSEVAQRVDWLARSLSQQLGWKPNSGSPWTKVITIYALNTIDSLPLSWAVHRLSGISSPANSAYSVSELAHQLKSSGSKALFTCWSLLEAAIAAARDVGIDEHHIYILQTPDEALTGRSVSGNFKTVDELISQGQGLSQLDNLVWERGQGARQCAFLNFSSGTTGLPKGVVVSHKNVIANILQLTAFEKPSRTPDQQDVVLGLLPQSHIYGLIVVCHTSIYRGESVIVMPKFDLMLLARAIQQFRINVLFVVPPLVISILNNQSLLARFDLSSVREIFTGAALLDAGLCRKLLLQYPSWKIRQAYGLTESATVISATPPNDIMLGSAGNLISGVEARLVSLTTGAEVTKYETPGELFVRSPSVTYLGYLNNAKATKETFGASPDDWLRTGDEAMFVLGQSGHAHLVIVDRIKELIKVKGHQVPPAELEACLLTHSQVADAAVIPVPDSKAGEVPKAFVVLKRGHGEQKLLSQEEKERMKRYLQEHIRKEKARYKWLKGGVEFVKVIPKSPSGKILRRILRDRERERRKDRVAKL
ncbi:hypothetical protein UA08_07377 [Talaromyces atroroseus]|uniref:AMP-dependent synthetase/ligase domain-containing protein n=1 Tax=Talaromyces atroroseus TaxID=1441469 RepID=A0A225AG17_TALAT|nr:hypothetical protein UA08_07377 [Talaromyces atroroseus]OKL57044.1 hypothetical protein UA08_07377 [Talaromyces atroroseus]